VQLGFNRFGALAAVTMAVALCGCANVDFDATQGWFSKPLDVFGKSGGYTYSELQEANTRRPITANDLVDASGACPALPVAAAPAPAPSTADNQGAIPAAVPASAPASLLGEGVALGMSECEVVYRAGQPNSVQLGKNQNGDRTALLTVAGGPRPGIYRFEAGRLMEIDRVAAPPPPAQAAKKKPVKSKQAARE
jgi:hypothetical protein